MWQQRSYATRRAAEGVKGGHRQSGAMGVRWRCTGRRWGSVGDMQGNKGGPQVATEGAHVTRKAAEGLQVTRRAAERLQVTCRGQQSQRLWRGYAVRRAAEGVRRWQLGYGGGGPQVANGVRGPGKWCTAARVSGRGRRGSEGISAGWGEESRVVGVEEVVRMVDESRRGI